jgi:cytochrome c oxidase cbb3-type subunit 3
VVDGDDTIHTATAPDFVNSMKQNIHVRRGVWALAGAALLSCVLAAQQAADATRGAPAEAATASGNDPMAKPGVQQGQVLFSNNCAGCHGPLAKGGIGPSLIASTIARHDVNGELIAPVVHDGRPSQGMPPFANLSSAEVAQIVAFLHARITATDSNTFRAPGASFGLSKLLTGDAVAGKQYFAAKCSSCHSATGDLAGIAKKYSPPDLESRMLMPRAGKPKGAVTLRNGSVVRGEIMRNDQYDVAVRDASGQYHSWPVSETRHIQVDDPLRGHTALLSVYTDGDIHNVFAYLETLQ